MPEADKTETTLVTDPAAGEVKKDPSTEDGKQTLLTETDSGTGQPKGDNPPVALSLKPPVGVDANDPGFLKFKKYAEEHRLTQAQAEKALTLYIESAQDGLAKQRAEAAATKATWAKLTQADPEIGGDKLPTTLTLARRALEKFGTSNLKAVLNESGLGNHPEVIRLLARTAKAALSEDTFIGTTQTRAPHKPSEDEILRKAYPSMFPKE